MEGDKVLAKFDRAIQRSQWPEPALFCRLEADHFCVLYPLDALDVKECYAEKIAWYDDTLRRKLMEEQSLIEDMETGLSKEQFVLYFQPQVNYADGTVVGAEALVRWRTPPVDCFYQGHLSRYLRKMDLS